MSKILTGEEIKKLTAWACGTEESQSKKLIKKIYLYRKGRTCKCPMRKCGFSNLAFGVWQNRCNHLKVTVWVPRLQMFEYLFEATE